MVVSRIWYVQLQCVAVCCSVLQCVAVCCSVWQCVAVFHGFPLIWYVQLQCVAVCCSVLQCVAVCCSVLWFSTYMVCPVAIHMMYPTANESLCCSVLQCVAVCCSVLQCVAVCCSVHMMYPTAKEICGISSCERALHIRGFYLYGTSICESISTAYCKEDVLYFQL